MTFVANCRDIFFPSPSRRPLLVFAGKRGYKTLLGSKTLSEKGVFSEKSISRDFRDSREPPRPWKTKETPTVFLEILENLEILEILDFPPVKRRLFPVTGFRSRAH